METIQPKCLWFPYHWGCFVLNASLSVPFTAKNWTYEGWGKNRPYDVNHPLYDPNNPEKRKHPEARWFLYYSLTINGETYWANVKMHIPMNGEVLYTIEKEKPDDLIEGVPT